MVKHRKLMSSKLNQRTKKMLTKNIRNHQNNPRKTGINGKERWIEIHRMKITFLINPLSLEEIAIRNTKVKNLYPLMLIKNETKNHFKNKKSNTLSKMDNWLSLLIKKKNFKIYPQLLKKLKRM